MMAEIQTLACGGANAYLVRGDGGCILIDTGTQRGREQVLAACGNVRLIVLTHGHFDHCQSTAWLADKLHCPVGVGLGDWPLVAQGIKRPVSGKGIWGRLFAAASNRNILQNRIAPIAPDIILEDGMSLKPYGVDGRIVALAGHTAGSVGVFLRSGELFVGDAMQNIPCPALAWCYECREDAQRSEARIRSLGATKIYYGHGNPSGALENKSFDGEEPI